MPVCARWHTAGQAARPGQAWREKKPCSCLTWLAGAAPGRGARSSFGCTGLAACLQRSCEGLACGRGETLLSDEPPGQLCRDGKPTRGIVGMTGMTGMRGVPGGEPRGEAPGVGRGDRLLSEGPLGRLPIAFSRGALVVMGGCSTVPLSGASLRRACMASQAARLALVTPWSAAAITRLLQHHLITLQAHKSRYWATTRSRSSKGIQDIPRRP